MRDIFLVWFPIPALQASVAATVTGYVLRSSFNPPMRKEAGFEVMDHIYVYADKNAKIADLIKKYADELKSEVMADNIMLGEMAGYTKEWNINGEDVVFGVVKVTK